MARSWDEVSDEQKKVYLLEGLARNRDKGGPIACRKCDAIFSGCRSLVRHCQTHHKDWTMEQTKHFRNFVPPENLRNSFSSSSHFTPETGESVLRYVSPNPPNMSRSADHLVLTMSRNIMQLRRRISAHRPQPYPSLSNYRAALNRVIFSSQRRQSSNFGSRFGSQPTGLPNLHSPVSFIEPGMFTSQSVQLTSQSVQLNFHSAGTPGESASPPIQQPNFSLPVHVGVSASYHVPSTSNLAFGRAIRSRMRPVRRATICDISNGHAETNMQQQEQPTQESVVIKEQNDEGDNNSNTAKVDVALKL